jgi:hypothetical protein
VKLIRVTLIALIIISLFPYSLAQNETYSETIITPHIGEGWESTRMRVIVSGEQFTTYLVADALFNLAVRDTQGSLRYEFGLPVLFGKRRYVPLTITLRGGRNEVEISYDRETMATGTTVSGEYWYYLKRTTDVAVVEYRIPLDNIEVKRDTSPVPDAISYGNPTVVTYRIREGDIVKLTTRYVRKGGIDYKKTRTSEEKILVGGETYTFTLTYPENVEALADDVRFFIKEMVPKIIEETGYPLTHKSFHITLKERGELDWAAAVNRGGGVMEFYIETPHGYPSVTLPHEIIHSYIQGVPTFINEGLANYFEWKVVAGFTRTLGVPSYAPQEWYWQTYERQYKEFVDIRTDYGESGNDKLESLISSKYDKGTYLITLIAQKAGEDTVREILQIIAKRQQSSSGPISLDYLVLNLSKKGEEVSEILRDPRFGFQVTEPGKAEVLHLVTLMKNDSWWSSLIALAYDYEGKVKAARVGNLEELKGEIEEKREFARSTLHPINISLILFSIAGIIIAVGGARIIARNKSPMVNQKAERERISLIKLKLMRRFGSMYHFQLEMAGRFGWENVENKELMEKLAKELGISV